MPEIREPVPMGELAQKYIDDYGPDAVRYQVMGMDADLCDIEVARTILSSPDDMTDDQRKDRLSSLNRTGRCASGIVALIDNEPAIIPGIIRQPNIRMGEE